MKPKKNKISKPQRSKNEHLKRTVNSNNFKSKNNHDEKSVSLSNTKKYINRKNLSLKERMELRIKGAKFRIMNERLYTSSDKDVKTVFESRSEFDDYHKGFRQQVNQWPINPLSLIIKSLERFLEKRIDLVIADFGCGEAELAETLKDCKVHSFDLFASNERVTACDMAKTKLASESVDVAVFCLSLMGSSNSRYIQEANRVLKCDGMLKIAEVESRFDNTDNFVDEICKHGFKFISQNLSHDVFIYFNFKKVSNISKKRKSKLPEIMLKPCMYKKR